MSESPDFIQVKGRDNYNKELNGYYQKLDSQVNGYSQYKQMSNKFTLSWRDGQWNFDWDRPNNSQALVESDSADVSQVESAWQVYDGSKYVEDPKLKVVALNILPYREATGPESIRISGRTGYNDQMNGLYKRMELDWNGRAQYKHAEQPFYLLWDDINKLWALDWEMIGSTYVKNYSDTSDPSSIQSEWYVWNPDAKQYNDVDRNIKVANKDPNVVSIKKALVDEKSAEIPEYVEVRGRVGYNYQMNGLYVKSSKKWESHVVYIQSGKSYNPFIIRWHHLKCKWIFDWSKIYYWFVESDTYDDESAVHPGMCQQWYVWNPDASQFELDPKLEIIGLSKAQYEQKILDATKLVPGPSYIRVSGRSGYNHEMNGLYCRLLRDWEGHACYCNPISSFTIRWHPSEKRYVFDWKQVYSWYVQSAGDGSDDVNDPSQITTGWWVWNSENASYSDFDSDIKVEAVSEDEIKQNTPLYIEVHGRIGYNWQINGLYELSADVDNKPSYQGFDGHVLYFNKNKKQWQFDWGNLGDRCHLNVDLKLNSKQENMKHPLDFIEKKASKWELFVEQSHLKKPDGYIVDPNLQIEVRTPIQVYGNAVKCDNGHFMPQIHPLDESRACTICGIYVEPTRYLYYCSACDVYYCQDCGNNVEERFTEIRTNSQHFNSIWSITWNPNGSQDIFATSSQDGTIKIWESIEKSNFFEANKIKTGCRHLQTIETDSYGHGIRFSKDGKYLFSREEDQLCYYTRMQGDENENKYDDQNVTKIKVDGSDLWDRSFLVLTNDWLLLGTDNAGVTGVNVSTQEKVPNFLFNNIPNDNVKRTIKGYYQLESCEVTARYSLIAGLGLPSYTHIIVQTFDVDNVRNKNNDTYVVTIEEEAKAHFISQNTDVSFNSIGFGGRDNLWLFAGDSSGNVHFWKIKILNQQDVDISNRNHICPKLEFVYVHISDRRHFRPVVSTAGCVGSDVIVSGSTDGNLVLWSLHDPKPAPSLFIEQAGGPQGYCNEIWSVDIRPGQAIFATWNRTVGMVHIVDNALVLLRQEEHESKHPKKKENHDEKTSENEDSVIRKKLDKMGVNDNTIAVESQQQWATIQSWYKVWIQGDSLLFGLRSMVKGIIDNLKKDKKEYIDEFKLLQETDATDFERVKTICNQMTEEISKENLPVLQDKNDIYNMMLRGYKVQKGLVLLAQRMCAADRIWGIFEGDPGIKKLQRSVEKCVLNEFEGMLKKNENSVLDIKEPWDTKNQKLDFRQLKDLSRAGILLRNMNAIYYALLKLKDSEQFFGMKVKIVRIKNRFGFAKSELGYRDILLNIILPEIDPTYIGELQLHHNAFHAIRARGSGHHNYKAARFLLDFVLMMAPHTNNKILNNESIPRDEIKEMVEELINLTDSE